MSTGQISKRFRAGLLEHWRGLNRSLGTSTAKAIELVSGPGGQRLYWLVLVSAHDLDLQLWDDVSNVNEQKRLPL